MRLIQEKKQVFTNPTYKLHLFENIQNNHKYNITKIKRWWEISQPHPKSPKGRAIAWGVKFTFFVFYTAKSDRWGFTLDDMCFTWGADTIVPAPSKRVICLRLLLLYYKANFTFCFIKLIILYSEQLECRFWNSNLWNEKKSKIFWKRVWQIIASLCSSGSKFTTYIEI